MILAPLGKVGINHNFNWLLKEGDHAKTVKPIVSEEYAGSLPKRTEAGEDTDFV
jgi:hypothetical protein